ncbi:MAG: UbiA family prenyltransferase [Planctomycetes bacterium]|nr:UbiA family prenyltransferase [Planctomycetota bacterium]
MKEELAAVRIWADMVKLSHSVFALPFALIAAFMAGRHIEGHGRPYWGQLGLVLICMVAGRSVAMTFNRIVDAGLDARNPRTAMRPLPAGKISLAAAWIMLAVSTVTFGVGCLGFYVYYGNTWPILLSGPVLLYLCGYSYSKRFTKWAHYYLGTAIAISPVAAWLAVHPESIGLPAVLLMMAVSCWIGGFDIIYSCQDIEVDRRDGLHSLPAKWGPAAALRVARISHVMVVVFLIALGYYADMGVTYGVGVAIVATLLIVENAMVKPDDFSRVNLAFFTMNGMVSLALGAAAIIDIVISSAAVSSQ